MSETSTIPPQVGLSSAELAELRELALGDFYVFAKGVMGYRDLTAGVHLPLCRLAERMDADGGVLADSWIQRLLCVIPRGWFKSSILSIAYPLWRAVRNSNIRVLVVQNTFTNAEAKLRAIGQVVKGNELFRALFPEVLPGRSETWKTSSMCLRRGLVAPESTFECAGTATQLTGRHYDLIIEDDTQAPDLDDMNMDNVLPSMEDIAHAIGFHRLTLPLLVNPSESQILVVGTRWFDEDLINHIKKNEKSFTVYERASREKDGVGDVAGEITFPERFPAKVLQAIEDSMGPYLFSCLYMNQPVRSKDMLFRPEWFRYCETVPSRIHEVWITVDPAGDPEVSRGEPDDNVIMVCGRAGSEGRTYVLDYRNGKWNPGEMIDNLFELVIRWKPRVVGIEAVAYQNSIQFWVKQRMMDTGVYFMVEEIRTGGRAKAARVQGLQPVIAAGALVFQGWMKELVGQLMIFPLGKNDDLADALAMQLVLWQARKPVGEVEGSTGLDDPLSLDATMDEIRGRRSDSSCLVLDAFEGVVGGGDTWWLN